MPLDAMSATERALRSAEEAGAREVPPAALYVKLSEEEISRAKAFIRAGKYPRAARTLERAIADAELAAALAKQAKAQAQGAELSKRLQTLTEVEHAASQAASGEVAP